MLAFRPTSKKIKMKNIYLDKDILNNLSDKQIEITWSIKNYSYVKEGEILGTVIYTVKEEKFRLFKSNKEQIYNILSPCDGFLFIYSSYTLYWDEEVSSYAEITYDLDTEDEDNDDWETIKGPLASIFKNYKELFTQYYSCKGSKVKKDPYSGLQFIEWTNQDGLDMDYGNVFSIGFCEGAAMLRFITSQKINKGDTISLLFNNGSIIDYPITTKPVKNGDSETSFILYQEDIQLLLSSILISYRITYQTTSKQPFTFKLDNVWWNPYKKDLVQAYVKNRIDTIKKLIPDYQFPYRTIERTAIEYKFQGCYVYLMKDISNGYHKIGISNKPEYREKTLQSEKPSIEMIACKKFPTRKIAEAIESALHTAYSQQRIRGEWFKLDDVDVAAIIETLK